MNLPLSGIKVVDLSNYVAAPGAARILADLGAEVIKIESFDGEKCVIARPPIRLNSVPYAPTKLSDRPGERTDEVLRAYGYSQEEITEMHACGAVK